MKINQRKHIDLFSGIGGFALAVDTVWPGTEHVFCDNNKFCQQVLKKHWPESEIYGDIRTLTNTNGKRKRAGSRKVQKKDGEVSQWNDNAEFSDSDCFILTGGFPCQPFSVAGRRRGTDDDRYLWPEMLRVIREFRPTWIIAENVRGLITWNEGMVLEQVCSDLEAEGYEVQPIIIPAVAVNAPHRRDRVWFIAHRNSERSGAQRHGDNQEWKEGNKGWKGQSQHRTDGQSGDDTDTASEGLEGTRTTNGRFTSKNQNVKNPLSERSGRGMESGRQILECEGSKIEDEGPGWEKDWIEVATELCRLDDGISERMVRLPNGTKMSGPAHRKESLKAYGNAIVPTVAIQIMKSIKKVNN